MPTDRQLKCVIFEVDGVDYSIYIETIDGHPYIIYGKTLHGLSAADDETGEYARLYSEAVARREEERRHIAALVDKLDNVTDSANRLGCLLEKEHNAIAGLFGTLRSMPRLTAATGFRSRLSSAMAALEEIGLEVQEFIKEHNAAIRQA